MALLVEVMLVLFIIVIITVPVMKHAIRVDRIGNSTACGQV